MENYLKSYYEYNESVLKRNVFLIILVHGNFCFPLIKQKINTLIKKVSLKISLFIKLLFNFILINTSINNNIYNNKI